MNDNRERDPENTQDVEKLTEEVSLDVENEDVSTRVEEIEEEEAEEAIDADDNPYQESDEALPDDEEEASISRNSSREGGLFDEV
ncbi:hypothetical protein GA830_17060 [Mesorhizobium sp. NBSH29]|uniref:hypothetical protein n=1 Tax=Mesorhizobium sp. NBSH29 TaxID=2654249 RepID=UPI0018965D7E|nr:hypothetical protein [Mesorhizobium sp. NBSH29]QPC88274.1 hypothetical protein GA830_17060 [Mesorhizobium sp. NBSH29]